MDRRNAALLMLLAFSLVPHAAAVGYSFMATSADGTLTAASLSRLRTACGLAIVATVANAAILAFYGIGVVMFLFSLAILVHRCIVFRSVETQLRR